MTEPTGPGRGKVALVTGATGGIGRATAMKLGADGFTVIVHGRNAARGADTVAAVEAAGGQARFAAATCPTPPRSRRWPARRARWTCW